MSEGTGGRRRFVLIAALTLAMATGATGTYTIAALSPFLVSEFDLSAGVVGLLVSAIYVTAASSSGVLGRRADRIDPAWIIIVGSACSLLAALAFALSSGIAVLLVFAVLAGLAMAASNPGSNGMIARRLPPGSRGYATGIKQSGATGTGLYIASIVPMLAVIIGWRWASLASLVIPVLALAAVLWSRRGPTHDLQLDPVENASAHPQRSRWLLWLTAYALALGVPTGICNAFYVLYSSEHLGFGAVMGGFVFATFAVVSVVARVFWARLADLGMQPGLLLVIIAVVGGVSAVLCLIAPTAGPWAMWVAAALAGGSIVGWNALAMVTIMQNVRVNAVGVSSARMLRGFFIGLAVGPLLFGLAVEAVGYELGWLLQLLSLVIAVVFAVFFGRELRASRNRHVV